MRQEVNTLTSVAETFQGPVIITPAGLPAFVGDAKDVSVDYLCARCATRLLEGILPHQIIGLAFKCHACGDVGQIPARDLPPALPPEPFCFDDAYFEMQQTVKL